MKQEAEEKAKKMQEEKEAQELEKKKQQEEQDKKDEEAKAKQDAEDSKEAKKSGEEMALSPAMDALLPQTQPTQEEIDNSIQLTQIGSEIGINKKSSIESEVEKKKHKKVEKKEETKKPDSGLSDETEKLLAEASAALDSKPDILKKAEAKKPEAKEEDVAAKDFEVSTKDS